MNLVELLFELLDANVPVDPKRFNGLKQQAKDWYYNLINDKPQPDGQASPPEAVTKFIKKYGELWYIQILMAAAFIPLNIKIKAWMAPDVEETDRITG